jgi:hypothetical protein
LAICFYVLLRAIRIELENARNHHDRLRPISILEHCELECFCAVDEKSAANALLILNDPIPPAVFANQKK